MLGHLSVKYARAMGAHVVAFTSSENKIEEIRELERGEVHDRVVMNLTNRRGAFQ